MSSEYSIHLSARPLEGRVVALGDGHGNTVALISEATEHANDERFTLFVKDDRLLEMSLLFHKIAQDLAALLPDVDACCRCVPGTPDDQCAKHGYGAFKIKRAGASCPLCDKPSPGGEVHRECVAREQFEADQGRGDDIPREEAAEHTEPEESICTTACDQPSEAHCIDCGCYLAGYEVGLETQREPLR